MKKILPLLLVWTVSLTAHAFSFSAPATTGQTLYFTIVDGTTVKVVAPVAVGWSGYSAPTGHLVIPAYVTNEGATYSVTAVDRMAFQDCGALASVVIPGSVVSIGQRAFTGDTMLTKAILQEGVQRIDMMAFSACTRLDTIELPSTLTRIAISAFDNTAYYNNMGNWSSEMMLTLGQWVIKEGNQATGTVQVPEGIVGIANNAFLYCRYVDKVVLPSTLRYVGDGAFKDCYELDTLQLGSIEPPAVSDDSFDGVNPLPVLVVPCSTAMAYNAAQYWNACPIVEVPCPSAIDEVGTVSALTVTLLPDGVMVSGAEGATMTVCDMMGRCVYKVSRAEAQQYLPLPTVGIYVLLAGNEAIKISYYSR